MRLAILLLTAPAALAYHLPQPHLLQRVAVSRPAPPPRTVPPRLQQYARTEGLGPAPPAEEVIAKVAAVAVAGGFIRSVVGGLVPRATLTLGAVVAVRAMPTGAVEAILVALVLCVCGLWQYFPFNFLVWAAGGGGFFSILYSCTVSVQRWKIRRRAARRRRELRGQPPPDELRAAVAEATRREAEPEPPGLVLLVLASLVFSVFGALP